MKPQNTNCHSQVSCILSIHIMLRMYAVKFVSCVNSNCCTDAIDIMYIINGFMLRLRFYTIPNCDPFINLFSVSFVSTSKVSQTLTNLPGSCKAPLHIVRANFPLIRA